MKFVKLLSSARVAGELRHPHEGVLHVSDEDAQRLFDNKEAEDVTDDFTAKQEATAPVDQIAEGVSEQQHGEPPEHPHQAQMPEQGGGEATHVGSQPADPQNKPSGRKAAAHKE